MLKLQWTLKVIRTNEEAEQMRKLFHSTNHTAGAFDTETTGLSHMHDLPFLFQFGWGDIETKKGYAFAVDIERQPVLAKQVIKVWNALAKQLPIYLGHNVTFDLHMLQNIGLPYQHPNISDTQIWIRMGTDAVQVKKGGAPMGLKDFSSRYIDSAAKQHEAKLATERTEISSQYNLGLKKKLGWTKKQIDNFFKDALNDINDLPVDKRDAYLEWLNTLPLYLRQKVTGAVTSDMIRYNTLNRDNVLEYALFDIVWTIEIYLLMLPIVKNRDNLEGVKLEESLIYDLLNMERVGFKVSKEYLQESQARTKQYIRERRQDLARLAGTPVAIGQHEVIRNVLKTQFNVNADTTNKDDLELLVSDLKREGNNELAVEFIETLQELRTLEKWYSTYMLRFQYGLKFSDRIYTQINSTGAVTGRVTSDFQQFPKGALVTISGEELFHPRKLVLVDGVDYIGTVYLDYSQIELRFQAIYTILVGHPDLNLCRAYMPYQCHRRPINTDTGEEVILYDPVNQGMFEFDYNNQTHIKNAYTIKWYYNEEPEKEWIPTDVHGATTKAAFHIDESHPDYKALRYVGKRVNFAKNYGAQYNKIKTMFPHFSDEEIRDIDGAYYKAFPGVKAYHDYCYAIANTKPCAVNLFGIKYYGVSGHNLINTLVQGSAAHFLKIKIREVNAYLRDKKYKSRMQMQIHDELSFEWHKDDPPSVFFELKEIMQDWEDAIVPIVAEMELTKTSWAEKYAIERIEDFET